MLGTQTLIVVCKEEILINQMKKLIENNDDEDSSIVGTKDDSIQIVAWNEQTWLAQKKAGNINNKILFIGPIKGVDKLIPVIDVQLDEYGVKYGWAGNQAAIWINLKEIEKEETYLEFLSKLNELPIPKKYKVENKESTETKVQFEQNNKNFWNKVTTFSKNAFSSINEAFKETFSDTFKDKKQVKRQMFLYGIMKLYFNNLNEFMEV